MYAFDYLRPDRIEDASALLAEHPEASLLAGGQTMLPVLRARLAAPSHVISLGGIAALKGVTLADERLVIGAAQTHAQVASDPQVLALLPSVAALAGGIGDVQVRHRGTIGGSVANNDPAACYPAALLALGARIITTQRVIEADAFFTGMFATALKAGEIITAVSFPRCDRAHYEKFRNPASRFALVGVCVASLPEGSRIAVTGAGFGVFRWHAGEACLDAGGTGNDLADVPLDADCFTGDLHGSADYRMHMTRIIAARAFAALGR
ncbi:carbon monoxide dehydrogenase [Novosphingobium sp. AAP83]|uniref:FAD binding domain-containing protein n=1 Tax=Novosphingobium sp. AAP83 TaxID=1523425 RepID=UPI0006B96005|nr:FAD binding domain-containing protein [Novosphingobium sp. AAP83]KPF92965.1 carbon monoxide dehydrogenase [Novosphingobium sp. AAP83]